MKLRDVRGPFTVADSGSVVVAGPGAYAGYILRNDVGSSDVTFTVRDGSATGKVLDDVTVPPTPYPTEHSYSNPRPFGSSGLYLTLSGGTLYILIP